jgi:hypothetical protein
MATLASYVTELLDGEEDRRRSFEQRGVAVITGSGTLATLLLGLVALVTKSDTFRLPSEAELPLGIALAMLTAACVFGLGTNIPLTYRTAKVDDVRKGVVTDAAAMSQMGAHQLVATDKLLSLESARKKNGHKATLLVFAQALQIVGVGALAVAAGQILRFG